MLSGENFRAALWLRLVVVLGFGIFVAVQEIYWLVAISAIITLVTVVQLIFAYREP